MGKARKGQAPAMLGRDEFHLVFTRSFQDPQFRQVARELDAVEEIAWDNYSKERKSPDIAVITFVASVPGCKFC